MAKYYWGNIVKFAFRSAAVAVVLAGSSLLLVPSASAAPAVVESTATTRCGSVVWANQSGWAAGTNLKYRWFRNGVRISDVWLGGYKTRSGDCGKTVTVTVTGTKAGKSTTKTAGTFKVRSRALSDPNKSS